MFTKNRPYTYLIGWSQHDKWYYGVRYSKKCDYEDLWIEYFTSSKRVKYFRQKHGEPDIILVRKTFNTPESAVLWEQKVLRRLDAQNDSRFLNMKNSTTSNLTLLPNSGSFVKKHKPWNKGLSFKNTLSEEERKKYGRVFTDEERAELSRKNKQRYIDSPELKDDLRVKAKEQFSDEDKKIAHKLSCKPHIGTIWINNGIVNKRISEEDFHLYNGFCKGRLIPDVTLDRMISSRTNVRDPETGRFVKGE